LLHIIFIIMKSNHIINLMVVLSFIVLQLSDISAKSLNLNFNQPSSIHFQKDLLVTQLKISGAIDKKIISTILNTYPNVVDLDMLNSKIVAFTDKEKVLFPANEIPIGVFNRKEKLKSVILPRNVTSIGKGAFWSCKNIELLVLPDSIKVIDQFAFQLCTKLKLIIFPKSLMSIGGACFAGCSSLKVVKYLGKNPPLMPEWNPFPDFEANNCVVYVPAESLNKYKEMAFLKDFQIFPIKKK